ncbi:MAG: NADH-quinone oxidoreductase subunit NuoN [Candidimonas sp.]|nr:MAG: NADH-quinone oxidoreductase subunit NuoN [Candidimonas sp.]
MHSSFQLALVAPEILLLILATVVLLADAFVKSVQRRTTFALTLASLFLLTLVSLWQWSEGVHGSAFGGMYIADSLSHLLKIASYIAVALILVYGRDYAEEHEVMLTGGEFYSLTLLTLMGQMVMISAGNMITVYMGIELMSCSLYALIALRRDSVVATEAAMKYFVLGALTSGILLYGMSMIYGATGELGLHQIAQVVAGGGAGRLPLVFGTVFIVAAFAFKLGSVPFHMWVPDVYDGSPTSVTLVVSTTPYLAVFAAMVRLINLSLHGVALDWQPMLLLLAMLSLAVGNIVAIAQTSFKRMLAYSMIAHLGYVFLGLLSGVVENRPPALEQAYGASLFYLLIYVFSTSLTFGLIVVMTRRGIECDQITDLRGLNRRSPLLAGALLAAMFSLAGIPPFAGFYAKLSVLQALVGADHVAVAVFAVMMSLIGAFYYLRVVKMAYFDEPEGEVVAGTAGTFANRLLSLNGLALLVVGVVPGGLMALCIQAIGSSVGFGS